MATNKRKDSAALFELIDKSTLKVPKHSSSLKIPSWWSSKSNPPSTASSSAPITTTNGNGNAAHAAETHSPPPPPPAPAPQSRLFQPPPADVPAAASPTIRPPVPPSGPRFAMVTAAEESSPETSPAPTLPTSEISEHELDHEPPPSTPSPRSPANSPENYAGLGAGRRVFAPQTMSQTDSLPRDWASQQKTRLARAPLWAMIAAGSGVVIFLLLIVYLFMWLHPGPTRANANITNPNSGVLPGPTSPASINPPQVQNPGPVTPPNETHPLTNSNNNTNPAATSAKVYMPGKVSHSPDLYYIQVLATYVPSNAQKDADFIAEKGVDVSIETQLGAHGRMLYKLFSVQGFKTITDAGPLQKRIVAIGHQLPEFQKTRQAWDGATIIKWSTVLREAPRN